MPASAMTPLCGDFRKDVVRVHVVTDRVLAGGGGKVCGEVAPPNTERMLQGNQGALLQELDSHHIRRAAQGEEPGERAGRGDPQECRNRGHHDDATNGEDPSPDLGVMCAATHRVQMKGSPIGEGDDEESAEDRRCERPTASRDRRRASCNHDGGQRVQPASAFPVEDGDAEDRDDQARHS